VVQSQKTELKEMKSQVKSSKGLVEKNEELVKENEEVTVEHAELRKVIDGLTTENDINVKKIKKLEKVEDQLKQNQFLDLQVKELERKYLEENSARCILQNKWFLHQRLFTDDQLEFMRLLQLEINILSPPIESYVKGKPPTFFNVEKHPTTGKYEPTQEQE